MMFGNSSPEALAARFTAVTHQWVVEGPNERTDRARRKLLGAIQSKEPATLNQVAEVIGRGAPAVSRSVERTQDPDNRRRLCLRLTQEGRDQLASRVAGAKSLRDKMGRLAQSELRAVERAIEILERGA